MKQMSIGDLRKLTSNVNIWLYPGKFLSGIYWNHCLDRTFIDAVRRVAATSSDLQERDRYLRSAAGMALNDRRN